MKNGIMSTRNFPLTGIGINDFTPSKVDSCIMFFVDMVGYSIDLDDEELPRIFESLDRQCREKLGKGCLDLLEEARAEMYE